MEVLPNLPCNGIKKYPQSTTAAMASLINIRPVICERNSKHLVENTLIANCSYSRLYKMEIFPYKHVTPKPYNKKTRELFLKIMLSLTSHSGWWGKVYVCHWKYLITKYSALANFHMLFLFFFCGLLFLWASPSSAMLNRVPNLSSSKLFTAPPSRSRN